jgi:hypothetical protein
MPFQLVAFNAVARFQYYALASGRHAIQQQYLLLCLPSKKQMMHSLRLEATLKSL